MAPDPQDSTARQAGLRWGRSHLSDEIHLFPVWKASWHRMGQVYEVRPEAAFGPPNLFLARLMCKVWVEFWTECAGMLRHCSLTVGPGDISWAPILHVGTKAS